MSEDTQAVEDVPVDLKKQELKSLKAKAEMIGLKFHPNIGLEKLKKKVNEQLSKDKATLVKEAKERAVDDVPEPIPSVPQTNNFAAPLMIRNETPAQKKMRLRKKASRLVRFRLTCMNPNKKKWPGEIFTVSNSFVGTFKRHIPFNANRWHCEEMLLNMIKDRKFTEFYEVKDKKGRTAKRTKLVREFAIDELSPLTEKEIADLKLQQGLANNLGDD